MVSKKERVSSYDQFHPGRFIKAGDLGDKPRTFLVKDYWREDLSSPGSGRDDDEQDEGEKKRDFKGILQFEEKHLGKHIEYPTQKTNEVLLAAMFGSDPRNVIGKRVTLIADKDRFGRKVVDAIRVYGSPDIDRPIEQRVEYSKRTGRPPKTFTLHPTGPTKAAKPPAPTAANLSQALAVIEMAPTLESLEAHLVELRKEAWSKAQKEDIAAAVEKRKGELNRKKPKASDEPPEEPPATEEREPGNEP